MYTKALNITLTDIILQFPRGCLKWGIAFGRCLTAEAEGLRPPPLRLREIPFSDPSEFFLKFYGSHEYAYLLESGDGNRKLARYSFLGFDPKLIVKIKNGEVAVEGELDEGVKALEGDPLRTLKAIVGGRCSVGPFRFAGGFVGYISYDAVRYWEKLPERAIDDLNFPDIEMGLFDDGVIFDHARRRAFYYYRGEDRLSKFKEKPALGGKLRFGKPRLNYGRRDYEKSVKKAKEYIRSGDVFQVVLSKRYELKFEGDLARFYLALKETNPSPYMYFLKMGERLIVGSSPEMLVRLEGRSIETFPIAGTRPRGKDEREDEELAKELLSDPKERAEHVMLVDLARNDVGKVSKFGSVLVPEFMRIYRYSHVQHIVSKVIGELKDGLNCYDVIKAVFPAGTVSGAPKVRAMEIIEELEPTRRGPYAGAVGYFSYGGNMDFAITIRTLVANGDKAYIQSGSGIVADSTPEGEWLETEHKARALLKALEAAGERGA